MRLARRKVKKENFDVMYGKKKYSLKRCRHMHRTVQTETLLLSMSVCD